MPKSNSSLARSTAYTVARFHRSLAREKGGHAERSTGVMAVAGVPINLSFGVSVVLFLGVFPLNLVFGLRFQKTTPLFVCIFFNFAFLFQI